ncbi:MAG TPA: hypothetical protein DDW90_11825 [Cyanobacteria bacterium UBA9971]|nr:hypothetical protein [Cyanobacteria bacterium UBA9971]
MIIKFSKKADKDLSNIDKQNIKRIIQKLKDFASGESADVILLKGYLNLYRLRVGDYRIIFEFIDGEIRIIHVLRI